MLPLRCCAAQQGYTDLPNPTSTAISPRLPLPVQISRTQIADEEESFHPRGHIFIIFPPKNP